MDEYEGYDYNKLKEAGKISRQALEFARSQVKPGRKLLEIAESIEGFIKDKGLEMSFPVNLSINESAAHYTPEYDDKTLVPEGAVLKVDLGARKDTCLTDCAITVSLSDKYTKLVEATEKALENAISMVKAGRKVNEIGREINKVATSYGFNPIKNLGGHGIEQDELHASVFIPNYDNGDNSQLQEGQVVAIEPFLTTGMGYVENGESLQIYQLISDTLPRPQEGRAVMEYAATNFLTYPFAMRWIIKGTAMSEFKVRRGITDLLNIQALEAFPVLVEKSKGIVAQAEKELIVDKDSCTIVT
ncbi:MAG: type II methionyl aminopeptidase [Candidatus Micrarchaeota archaeon]|nr:type II methionyl aminopeptidase [Candidatus Micrarchaeota archaeon]MDE1859709.1 type II methionyl aminopeptidase [Candidatus Micrarchaeota archaeon]